MSLFLVHFQHVANKIVTQWVPLVWRRRGFRFVRLLWLVREGVPGNEAKRKSQSDGPRWAGPRPRGRHVGP